ncbi:Ig-like domain-containing protein [Bacillus thuringiensis]|uniref:Ig-like domain-containing protein n=1 Tax=Bacillus thuringiensis TaxID=1428 RepID=UPI0021B17EE2|nr:hypothetical protein [Bacillus thuringiensis]
MDPWFIKDKILFFILLIVTILCTIVPINIFSQSINHTKIQIKSENHVQEVLKLSFEDRIKDDSVFNHNIVYKNGAPSYTEGRVYKAIQFQSTNSKDAPPIRVADISMDQPSIQIHVDGHTYVQAKIQPAEATDKNVTWISCNYRNNGWKSQSIRKKHWSYNNPSYF